MKCRQFKCRRAKTVPNILDNLESKRNRWDVEKLKPAPADLKKLGDVAGKDVLKRAVYNQLVAKVKGIEGKIPSITGLFIKSLLDLTVFNNWICWYKDIKRKKTFCRKSFSKSFEMFCWNRKWNEAQLLVMKVVYTSFLTSCWTS